MPAETKIETESDTTTERISNIPQNGNSVHDPTTTDYSAEVHVISNPILRALAFVLGIVCVGVGIAGFVLPLIPGFPLLLAAAYLFSKSSVRYYNWLMNHKTFGPIIRNYNAGQGLPLRVKITAVGTLWLAVSISTIFFMDSIYPRVIFIVIASAVSYHIISLPTSPKPEDTVERDKRGLGMDTRGIDDRER